MNRARWLVTTMHREKEPELMTAPDQVLAYALTDFSSSEERLISQLASLIKAYGMEIKENDLIIDLGCGPGNITERLFANWPSSTIVGIDDSLNMLLYANKKQRNNLRRNSYGQILYEKINISSIAKSESKFINCADLVVSNSLLHHIHNIKVFFDALVNLSKKGTIHYHRDLRRPSTLNEVLYLKKKHLPDANDITTKDFIASLKAAYTFEEITNHLEDVGIDFLTVKEVDDRYIDIVGIYP